MHRPSPPFDEATYLGDPVRRAPFVEAAKLALERLTADVQAAAAPFGSFSITFRDVDGATRGTVHLQREVWIELRDLTAPSYRTTRIDHTTFDLEIQKMAESVGGRGGTEALTNKPPMYVWAS